MLKREGGCVYVCVCVWEGGVRVCVRECVCMSEKIRWQTRECVRDSAGLCRCTGWGVLQWLTRVRNIGVEPFLLVDNREQERVVDLNFSFHHVMDLMQKQTYTCVCTCVCARLRA